MSREASSTDMRGRQISLLCRPGIGNHGYAFDSTV